ncbi:helix-turn-helix domain-containing protein [Saccharopolyspora sp. 5N102]|uniref:helix-turn-helix domain-containing protein n=1 Tax=Saccharopolyspora sp. 5N102 TaxID=3375155 RepID=UPI00378F29CC
MSVVERHGDEVWRLWLEGFGQREIGRELGISRNSVAKVVAPAGGIAPVPRRRAVRALSFAEREEISRGLSAGKFLREIARELVRDVSVISREVARNGGREGYRATDAEQAAWRRGPCHENRVSRGCTKIGRAPSSQKGFIRDAGHIKFGV